MPLKSSNNKALDRFNNAVNILLKYGFQGFLVKTGLLSRKLTQKRFPDIDPTLNKWQRIRLATQDLGPTAVRLAKFLSLKPDILPDELILEFNNLEFNKLAVTKADAIEIFESFTKRSAKKTFQFFDTTSVLQDSFTSTFRAKLLTGEDVAVKVLSPKTKSAAIADISLFMRLAEVGSGVLAKFGVKDAVAIVEEFKETILPELDLLKESDKVRRFNKAYHGKTNFVVPELFSQYSTTNTLVSYYYNSTSVADAKEFVAWGLRQKSVADNFLDIFISGMLDTGLFLNSPIKEIIRVLPDGKIYFMDYGTAELLTTDQRRRISEVVSALSARSSSVLAYSIHKLSNNTEIYDYQLFKSDIQSLADNLYFLETSDYYMREFSLGLMRIAYKHKLSIPREVVSAFNALVIAESIALTITPSCRISELLKSYGKKLQYDKSQSERTKTIWSNNFAQLSDFMEVSPQELTHILRKVRAGELHTNISVSDFGSLVKQFNVSINKFSFTILIATLILSSTIVLVFGQNMYMFLGMPLIAFIGYVSSVVLSFILIIYNARKRS